MRAFFRGWRRKIGVATLVLTCVFGAGWVRSLVVRDSVNLANYFKIPMNSGNVSIIQSQDGLIQFMKAALRVDSRPIQLTTPQGIGDNSIGGEEFEGKGQLTTANVTVMDLSPFITVPYWSIVLPLTLLSAWLLLSKPRKPATVPTEEAA